MKRLGVHPPGSQEQAEACRSKSGAPIAAAALEGNFHGIVTRLTHHRNNRFLTSANTEAGGGGEITRSPPVKFNAATTA